MGNQNCYKHKSTHQLNTLRQQSSSKIKSPQSPQIVSQTNSRNCSASKYSLNQDIKDNKAQQKIILESENSSNGDSPLKPTMSGNSGTNFFQTSNPEHFIPPKELADIENFLLSVKLNAMLIKGCNLKDIIIRITFPSTESQLNLVKKVYQKLRNEENYLESYRKHQGLVGEIMKRIVQLLNYDMERLGDLSIEAICNQNLPNLCLEGILKIYHILLSHKLKSNDSVDIWWSSKKNEKKLDSVVSTLIEISGKIKYEFDKKRVEKNFLSNLHDASFLVKSSKSLTKDFAFESEFLKNKEKAFYRESSGSGSPLPQSPKTIEKYTNTLEGFWENQEKDNMMGEDIPVIAANESFDYRMKTEEKEPSAFTLEKYTGDKTVGRHLRANF